MSDYLCDDCCNWACSSKGQLDPEENCFGHVSHSVKMEVPMKWLEAKKNPPPKDGTPILIYMGDWTAPFHLHCVPVIGLFGEYHPNARGRPRWRTAHGQNIYQDWKSEPQWWMPLPPPYNEKQEKKSK